MKRVSRKGLPPLEPLAPELSQARLEDKFAAYLQALPSTSCRCQCPRSSVTWAHRFSDASSQQEAPQPLQQRAASSVGFADDQRTDEQLIQAQGRRPRSKSALGFNVEPVQRSGLHAANPLKHSNSTAVKVHSSPAPDSAALGGSHLPKITRSRSSPLDGGGSSSAAASSLGRVRSKSPTSSRSPLQFAAGKGRAAAGAGKAGGAMTTEQQVHSSIARDLLRDEVASAALRLRSKAEANVQALSPHHRRQDRFGAVDAAVVEVAESQPVLGPLLWLVAELYSQAAADHQLVAAAAGSSSIGGAAPHLHSNTAGNHSSRSNGNGSGNHNEQVHAIVAGNSGTGSSTQGGGGGGSSSLGISGANAGNGRRIDSLPKGHAALVGQVSTCNSNSSSSSRSEEDSRDPCWHGCLACSTPPEVASGGQKAGRGVSRSSAASAALQGCTGSLTPPDCHDGASGSGMHSPWDDERFDPTHEQQQLLAHDGMSDHDELCYGPGLAGSHQPCNVQRRCVRWQDGPLTQSSRPPSAAPVAAEISIRAAAVAAGSGRGSTRGTTRTPSSSDDECDGTVFQDCAVSNGATGQHGGCDSSDALSSEASSVGGADIVTASNRRMSLVSDRYRGSSFGGGSTRHHVLPLADAGGTGDSSAGLEAAAADDSSPSSGDEDYQSVCSAAGAASARGSYTGSGCSTSSCSGNGQQGGPHNMCEDCTWGRTLTTDEWVAAPEGVSKLDLTDLEGKIHEQRQKRFAAFRAERARLAAAAGSR